MRTYQAQTIGQLLAQPVTKGDIFKDMGECYDYAMPQDWLDAFADWCKIVGNAPAVTYDIIRGTTVWAYPKQGQTGPVTCCVEVLQAWKKWEQFLSSHN